jgi:heterodisulfide reductase subunit C
MKNDDLLALIQADPRYEEACRSCLNCGVCTAICPAAGYYDYDPRIMMNMVTEADEETLKAMLSSDMIWQCGQCMSCKPRCPRGNVPGTMIQILRSVATRTGLFTASRLGRQQLSIKRAIGHTILETGYCIHPTRVDPATHPEQGPVWEWMSGNADQVYGRFDSGYDQAGPGLLRKISPAALGELARIFEITGCMDYWDSIEGGAYEPEAGGC